MKTIEVIKEQGGDGDIKIDDHLDAEEVDDAIAAIKAELESMGVRVSEIGMLFYELKEKREGLRDGIYPNQAARAANTVRPTPPGSLARNLPRVPGVRVKPNGQVHMRDRSRW